MSQSLLAVLYGGVAKNFRSLRKVLLVTRAFGVPNGKGTDDLLHTCSK